MDPEAFQPEARWEHCMTDTHPLLYVARHGETDWSRSGQHTGRTDLPLTDTGRAAARALGHRLAGLTPARVFTSPLLRARQTCELAGFSTVADVQQDLLEWDYGDYEGMRTSEILRLRPGWELFTHGSPGGESPAEVASRADSMIARIRATNGLVIVFSSGHILRALAARWLGLPLQVGAKLLLDTASLSILGYGHDRSEPAIRAWNETSHLRPDNHTGKLLAAVHG
jgi:broad specificity phosphatase PhoE